MKRWILTLVLFSLCLFPLSAQIDLDLFGYFESQISGAKIRGNFYQLYTNKLRDGSGVVVKTRWVLGEYPSIGLGEARTLHDAARRKVKSGIDPKADHARAVQERAERREAERRSPAGISSRSPASSVGLTATGRPSSSTYLYGTTRIPMGNGWFCYTSETYEAQLPVPWPGRRWSFRTTRVE